jgi:dihydroneopterin aldolase
MLKVSLHKIVIHRTIGLYDEELILNNKFEVDVDVIAIKNDVFIDYVILNQIVQSTFKMPLSTLEALSETIVNSIKKEFEIAIEIVVKIRKYNPPMAGEIGHAQVEFSQQYS